MSTLTWEPESRPKGELSGMFLTAARKRFGSILTFGVILTRQDYWWLHGLSDAGIDEAMTDVWRWIEKHGNLVLKEEA